MTKGLFYQELKINLKQFSNDEVERIIQYYEELINDKMETGMSEEEAVASFGEIKTITAVITADLVAKRSETSNRHTVKNFRIILGICASPILLPIGIAFAALFFSLVIVFIALFISFSASAFAVIVSIVPGVIELVSIGTSPAVIVLGAGVALFAGGLLLLLAIGVAKIGTALLNQIIRLFSKTIKKRSLGGKYESI